MDEPQNKAWKVGDLKLIPTQQNSGVVVKRAGSAHSPEMTLAAFTTTAEMIAWLAEQYGVENHHWGEQPPTPFVPSGDIRDAKTREEAAPRYVWKTREDFVAALTMALTVLAVPPYGMSFPPADHARKLADIIDSVHAQGIGE